MGRLRCQRATSQYSMSLGWVKEAIATAHPTQRSVRTDYTCSEASVLWLIPRRTNYPLLV